MQGNHPPLTIGVGLKFNLADVADCQRTIIGNCFSIFEAKDTVNQESAGSVLYFIML